ncbi:penicillin G acylase [Oleiphilus messinensis]|uniref:Penicillin G acylase n=1 Tax=Oleiphilus messinensis TaxID=141451 RepID=A0A1Y0IFZ7_9GAMM|nr:penicillin acylase family protein [Oleiphilus messinensis]ARU59160.1 penicillin G acylase [Oleiphilus messinensis]
MGSSVIKKTGIGLTGILIVLVGIGAYVYFIQRGYIEPELNREISSAALQQKVDVYRDGYGIPHIFGESLEDVYFAVGYTMAEERLTQVELIRRTAKGELAEIFGPKLVDYDKWSRSRAYTQEELSTMIAGLHDNPRKAFLAMVKGLNHYIQEAVDHPDEKRPIEFDFLGIELQPFTPEDILSGITLILRKFGSSGGTELTNQAFLQALVERYGNDTAQLIFDDILPLADPDAHAIADDSKRTRLHQSSNAVSMSRTQLSATALAASAEFREQTLASVDVVSQFGISQGASRTIVIGPERSATGNPLILQGTADGREIHIKTPEFEFAGLTVPPMGIPLQGKNMHIGTVVTTGERDTIDIFALQTDPDNPNRYRYRGQWHDMELRTETINVKGAEPVSFELATTVHGRVILRDQENNTAYAQRWAMWMEEANVWASALEILNVQSADDLAENLNSGFAANSNLSYADKNGHIGFRHTGNLPIRSPGADPRLPANGDGSQDWLGMTPHSENPGLRNPGKGFIHAWNNTPASGITYGDGSRWGKHFRTHLPLELIAGKNKISIADLKAFNRTISASFYSVDLSLTSPAFFAPYLKAAAARMEDPQAKQAVQLMLEWNGLFLDKDGDGYYDHPGAILFRTWLPTALETVFSDDIDDWWRKLDDDVYIPYQTSLLLRALEGKQAGNPMQFDYFNGQDPADLIAQSVSATVKQLHERFESDDLTSWLEPVYWRYMVREDMRDGEKHTFNPKRSTRYGGGAVKLRYLPKAFIDNGAPDWLSIMEITPEKPYYLSAIPSGGQSWFINTGWKASPHINDQQTLHEALEFKTVHLDEETILKEHQTHLVIRPVID